MFIGQLVLKGLVGYGEWTRRGGDGGVFACDLLGKSTNATLDIAIQHSAADARGPRGLGAPRFARRRPNAGAAR